MKTKVSVQYYPVGLAAAAKLGQPELFCAGKHPNHSLLCLRAEKQGPFAPPVFVLSEGKCASVGPSDQIETAIVVQL